MTVFIISACYSHIIEEFPSGGGGYLVASKLLGKHVGVVSGCALLVDYALTITVSIAAAGDALYGLLNPGGPLEHLGTPQVLGSKLAVETAVIVLLILLNLRGIKESVMVLLPIFMIFLITHAILIVGAVTLKFSAIGAVVTHVTTGIQENLVKPEVGLLGMLLIFLRAYSMGAGTYTGIEAVSNSMPVMREPRVATGKRTMLYMATSLAVTAGGLMVAYLLLDLKWTEEPTMNHSLCEQFVEAIGLPGWLGTTFVLITVISEGFLLFVAAQAGFIDGPRVLANMARDSWMPHWFASLSERLATKNGVLLMGFAGMAALWSTGGNVYGAGDHVFDQCVRHVFAVDDRHVPPLVGTAPRESAVAAAAGAVRCRRSDVPVDSGGDGLRKVRRRRLQDDRRDPLVLCVLRPDP